MSLIETKKMAHSRGHLFSTIEELSLLLEKYQNSRCDTSKIKISCRELNFLPLFSFSKNTYVVISPKTNEQEVFNFCKLQYPNKNIKVICVTNRDMSSLLRKVFKDGDIKNASNLFHERVPLRSAKELGLIDKFKLSMLILPIIAFFIHAAVTHNFIYLEVVLSIVFISAFLFKLLLTVKRGSWFKKDKITVLDEDLPMYSILVPLYKEKNILSNLKNALSELDYPNEKLDIKLIFEHDDIDTLEYAKSLGFPFFFDFIVVPEGKPKTKPRACNYALPYCKGEYVVIYDAEDRPEPDQLKKVISKFNESPDKVVCVQSALNWYNRRTSILASFFSIEYMQWFKFLLPGLQKTNVPIPLGGTSNHFKRNVLIRMFGWDAYNVTEDAELGVRLFENRYKTVMVDSTTWEEAPTKILSWIKQRSRWVKGHMITFVIYLRKSDNHNLSFREKSWFLLFIGIPILSFIFTLPAIFFAGWAMMSDDMLENIYSFILYVLLIPNLFGILLNVFYCIMEKEWRLLLFTPFLPIYWLLHGAASLLGLYEFYFTPHSWRKTEHGNKNSLDK